MKKQIVALMALLVVGLSSCNKDDDKKTDTERPKTKVEILTEKTWNIQSVKYTETTDHSSSEYEIPMTGTVTFKTDNTVVTKLPGEEDQVSVWALNADVLVVDGEEYDLLKLTQSELVIYQEGVEEGEDGESITYSTELKMNR